MNTRYPTSFDDIRARVAGAGVTVAEGRARFAQYAVLLGISQVRVLRDGLVCKGGNALDFDWQPNRSTVDLDFWSMRAASWPRQMQTGSKRFSNAARSSRSIAWESCWRSMASSQTLAALSGISLRFRLVLGTRCRMSNDCVREWSMANRAHA